MGGIAVKSGAAAPTWSAKQYLAFEEQRTRPVRDLLAALPAIDARQAIDLGCGPGNSTEVLAARFPGASVSGIDSSADMIEAARRRLPKIRFSLDDIENWMARAADEDGAADVGGAWSAVRFDVILANAERAAFLERYQSAVARAYPALADDSVLLPFPRLFIIAVA